MLITSADSHLPAISNEDRVRVESSKNRLTTVRPRRVGQLLDLRRWTSAISSARSRISMISSRSRSAADSRWRISSCPSRSGRLMPDLVARRRSPSQPHADPLAAARWAGSCRRGRPGSAARGGRGRPARPAGRRAAGRGRRGRPARRGRCGRSRARRRPAPRRLSSMPGAGMSVCSTARVGCRRRSSRYIVTSRAPTGTATPSTSAIAAASRRARATPRVGMPSSTRSVGALVALEDLVRHRGAAPGRRRPRSSRPARRRLARRRRVGGGNPGSTAEGAAKSGRIKRRTSFPASQDRSLKDVESCSAEPTVRAARARHTVASGQARVGLTSARRASRPLTNFGRVVGGQARGQRRPPRRSRRRRGPRSRRATSNAPSRRIARSTLGIRSRVQPWRVGREQLVDVGPVRDDALDEVGRCTG